MIIIQDESTVFEIQNEEGVRELLIGNLSTLTSVHQATLLYQHYIEDSVKYNTCLFGDSFITELREGSQFLTSIMIDAVGFKVTTNEQKRINDHYRSISMQSLVRNGYLPAVALEGGESGDVRH